jgi:hypothetical protein
LNTIGRALGSVLLDAVKALAPLLVQVAQLIATLAQAFAGPLGFAIQTVASLLGILLGILNPLVKLLAPLAPLITAAGAAWLTWRTLSGIVPVVKQFGAQMTYVGTASSVTGRLMGAAGSAVSALGGALPVIGVAIGLLSMAMADSDKRTQDWTDALNKGGRAAATARAEMEKQDSQIKQLSTGWMGFLQNFSAAGSAIKIYADDTAKADAANQAYLAGLSPVEATQRNLTIAQEEYNRVVSESGAGSSAAAAALLNVANLTAGHEVALYSAAAAAGDYATTTDMVAAALWREVDAQSAANSATAGAELGAVGAARAAEALAKAQESGDPLAIAEAQGQLTVAMERGVTGAENAAKAFSQSAEGQAKYGSAAAAFRASIQGQISSLDDLISKTSGPAQQSLIDLRGRLVTLTEGTYDTDVNIIIDDAMANVLGLDGELAKVAGTKVTAEVFAQTKEADVSIMGTLGQLANIDGKRTEAQVTAATQDATSKINLVLGDLFKLDNTSTQAEITAATDKAKASISDIIYGLAGVDATTASPEVKAQVETAIKGIDDTVLKLSGLDQQTANPKVVVDAGPPLGSVGAIHDSLIGLGGQVATPTAALNNGPFGAGFQAAMNNLSVLNNGKAIPSASLNNNSFYGTWLDSMAKTNTLAGQRPQPVASLADQASGPLAAIKHAIDALYNKTITVTTNHVDIGNTGRGTAGQAGGGLVDSNRWTTVGEEGRELVFLTQGQYVATYQKSQRILAAASIQAGGQRDMAGGSTTLPPVSVASPSGITIPITVNPSPGMNEMDLARKTSREFAFRLRKT